MQPDFNEIAGIENGRDITRGWVNGMGMYLPTQDSLLNLKSGGDLRLYEEIRQDPQVKSCYQQRFSALVRKEFKVEPGGESKTDIAAADWLRKELKKPGWDKVNEKMLWGIHYGYSIAEILYNKNDSKIGIEAIKVRNRRRFKFGVDMQPLLLTFDNPMGMALPERKFWHFCTGADNDDEPDGRGLGFWLYWLTWFKRNDIRWWITFLENFADPSAMGSYPTGATDQEKATLRAAVQSVGKKKWAIKPEGMLIEYLEATRSGAADYEAMHSVLDAGISKVILSQTMTTDNGSSNSQAQVHENVADSVVESDADLLCDSFRHSVAKWLIEWNFPNAEVPLCFRELGAPPDLKALAERDNIIVGMGFPANPDYIVETYGAGFKQVESETEPPYLNGAQLQAFVSLIAQAQQGDWSPDMVLISLQIAFPAVPDTLLSKMAKSMESLPAPASVDPNNPQASTSQTPEQAAQSLDAVAAQFAAGTPKKQKNCVKGIPCKGQCIAASKICRQPLTDTQKQKKQPIVAAAGVKPKVKAAAKSELSDAEMEQIAAEVDAKKAEAQQSEVVTSEPKPKAKSKSKVKPVVDPASEPEQGDLVKTNDKNLDAARKSIVDATSEEAVKKVEAAASNILNSEDTGIFVRVGSNQTLAAIIGDRFKNSVELGGDADVPGLTEPYQDARKRVEREQMGYSDDSDPTKRPIYAYMGNSKNLQSASHKDVAAFGDITIKLRDDVKSRATFTGADSFKSGVASKVGQPSAASLIQSRQHGKPIETDDVADTIDRLGKAKNIDELMSATSGQGNRYMEAQIHGQVKPSDIGEIHFNGKGEPPIPSKEVRDWAAKNDVKLFKDGKPYEHIDVSDDRRKEIAKQMTPEVFKDYVKQKAKRIEQDNPSSLHNMTYDEFVSSTARTINSKRMATSRAGASQIKQEIARSTGKDKFAEYLETAANKGFHVPDRVIDSIPVKGGGGKVSAATISNIRGMSKLNKDDMESKSQLHKDMDAILDSPILSDSERASHKPMMSEKEANAYVKGGAFGDHTFYHGSSSEGAIKSITEKGVKISANTTGLYGGGFYRTHLRSF